MKTFDHIAEFCDQPARGNVTEIHRVDAISQATRSAVVFATAPETLREALSSEAGLILASHKLQPTDSAELPDPRLVWVPDARLAFARVAQLLSPARAATCIHPSAILGQALHLGEGSTIGAGTIVGDRVTIGKNCTIDASVTIYPDVQIHDHVRVQAGAVLGSTGFGYARDPSSGEYLPFPQQGTLIIEDHVDIGANTTIDRGALGETRIGRGSKLDNLVHVGHNVRIGRNVIIAAQTGISGSSVIEDGAIVAGQVGIAEHVNIGPGVILGAKCGVPTGKKLRGPGEVFWGIPARPIREYLRDLAKLRRS